MAQLKENRLMNKQKINLPKPRVTSKVVQKPEIPDKTLTDFLEKEINISKLEDISKIRAAFLWEVGGIERYRIDIWNKAYVKGSLYPSTKIIHSFFAYYYREKGTLVDKTNEK
jgi:hypothetical protein